VTAKEEIAELLKVDLAIAGKDLEMLRDLENFLEPLRSHPLVRYALAKIDHKICFLETGVCRHKEKKQ
jgi:hypothetical protein